MGRRVRRDPDLAGAGPGAARRSARPARRSSTGCGPLLYMPCLTLPAGDGPDGLPVGIQLVGRRHDDARLLDVGLWVEARCWEHGNEQRPTGFPPPRRSTQLASGALTAEALMRACLDRIDERAVGQGLDLARSGAGPGAGARRRPRRPARPARRRADRGQGHHRHRRHADRARLADLSRQPARSPTPPASRCCARPAASIIGKTVTTEFANRHPGRDRQPAQPGAHARRLVERLGRRGRRLPGAARRSARRPAAR